MFVWAPATYRVSNSIDMLMGDEKFIGFSGTHMKHETCLVFAKDNSLAENQYLRYKNDERSQFYFLF